jgi:DNA-binding MarR family transcriptional regulator
VEIFRLNGLLLAAGDALADPAGQTSARWRVLAAIEKKPLPVATIARNWGLARQSIQRLADVLVRDGMAFYEENPSHRRAQLLVLAPKGLIALRSIQSAQVAWANRLGAEIGENELRQAIAILSQVQRIVSKK